MKAAAWSERRTARDLFDLARLNELGVIDAETAGLARQLLGRQIRGYDFTGRAPADWQQQLTHQTTHLPDPQECLGLVGQAWEAAARALSPDG